MKGKILGEQECAGSSPRVTWGKAHTHPYGRHTGGWQGYVPRPHHSGLGECQGELGATLDLAHALAIQPFNVLGNVTAFTSSPAQFSEVPITPGKHQT